jgi:CBS domain-containing protein
MDAAARKLDAPTSQPPRSGVFAAAGVRPRVSWPAVAVKPEATVYAALDILDAHQFHHLLVAKDGALLGMLCSCDLFSAPLRSPAGDFMSRDLVWLHSDATLARAKTLMETHGVGALPVSDYGSWGILTRGDLIRAGYADRMRCMDCDSSHHLRPHTLYEDELLCRACKDEQRPARSPIERAYLDLGVCG